jgi:hypothetical protein
MDGRGRMFALRQLHSLAAHPRLPTTSTLTAAAPAWRRASAADWALEPVVQTSSITNTRRSATEPSGLDQCRQADTCSAGGLVATVSMCLTTGWPTTARSLRPLQINLGRGGDPLGRKSGAVTRLGDGARRVSGEDGEQDLVGRHGEQIEQPYR